jgi:ribosomal protein S1
MKKSLFILLTVSFISLPLQSGMLKYMQVEGKVVDIKENHIVVQINQKYKSKLPKKVLSKKSYKLQEQVKIILPFNKVREIFKTAGVSGGGDGTD